MLFRSEFLAVDERLVMDRRSLRLFPPGTISVVTLKHHHDPVRVREQVQNGVTVLALGITLD